MRTQVIFFVYTFVTVPKDPNPQWRRVAWSHDCTLLAYADSTGTVRLFDLMGSEIFVIPPVTMPVVPLLLQAVIVLGFFYCVPALTLIIRDQAWHMESQFTWLFLNIISIIFLHPHRGLF